MNPISELKKEKENFDQRFRHLMVEHDKLVDQYVILENLHETFENSVSEMCNSCNMKGTLICASCPLHDIGLPLWEEN